MGEIPRTEDRRSPIRRLGRTVEPIHTVAYYSPEIYGFNDDGFKGWWHAYFAYRSAPMGRVSAATVTAVFYNFAPRMVERAVPGCWDIMEPDAVRARQLELTTASMQRALGDYPDPDEIAAAADALRSFAGDLPVGARPLYAGWAAEPWPGDSTGGGDVMDLWHGCTLLREFRFDGHNIALAAGDLDPVECHVMMTTGGHGKRRHHPEDPRLERRGMGRCLPAADRPRLDHRRRRADARRQRRPPRRRARHRPSVAGCR